MKFMKLSLFFFNKTLCDERHNDKKKQETEKETLPQLPAVLVSG